MPRLHISLLPRTDDDGNTSFSSHLGIYVAGLTVAGVIVLGLAVWLGIRIYRRRSASKREDDRGAAFLSVRGLVKDGEKGQLSNNSSGDTFSRDQITPSIVLPEKVLVRPPPLNTREDIINHHRESGTFPRPFAPMASPFSFALSAGGSTSNRSSVCSRFSVISSANSSVSTAHPTSGHLRKVRQLFNPVLPDELLITSVGEQLTVVDSFDDGWCVVGREASIFSTTKKSLFNTNPEPKGDNEVELGVVPAWCFLKPVPGLKAERPIRSTSLGITVQMDGPGFSSRDEVRSWSNF